MQHRRCEELAASYQTLTAEKRRTSHADEELARRLGETLRLLRGAAQTEDSLRRVRSPCMRGRVRHELTSCARQDVLARRELERYTTGEETRDMLEVRRGDARLHRVL